MGMHSSVLEFKHFFDKLFKAKKFKKNNLDAILKVAFVNMIYNLNAYMYVSLLSPYLLSLGYDTGVIGIYLGIFPFVQFLLAPMIGSISDKIGRTRLIKLGFGLQGIVLLNYILFNNLSLFLFNRILESISFTCISCISLASVEDKTKDNVRAKMTGILLSINTIGVTIAPVIGGFLIDMFNMRVVFSTSFLLILIGLFLILPQKNEVTEKNIPKKDLLKIFEKSLVDDIKRIFSNKELRKVGFIGIGANFGIPATVVILPLVILNKFGLDYKFVGFSAMILTLTHLFQYAYGGVIDKFKSNRVIFWARFIECLLVVSLFFVQTYQVFLIMLFLIGLVGSFWSVSAWSYLSEVGEKLKVEGGVVGGYISIVKLSTTVSMFLTGYLLNVFSLDTMYVLYGSVGMFFLLTQISILKPITEKKVVPVLDDDK